MTYQVVIEGQTIPVPEEIGASDEAVKRALAPFYPDVANALVTRVTKDEVTTITVVKRAGTKGQEATPLDYLVECASRKNPAIELYERINDMGNIGKIDPALLLELDQLIEAAVSEGEEQRQAVETALQRLVHTTPRPAPMLIAGI